MRPDETMIDQNKKSGLLTQERGFILMLVYLMLAVLTIVSIAIFSQSINFIQNTDRNRKRIVAFNLAEAGFDNTYHALREGTLNTFPYSSGYTSMNSGSVRGGYSVEVIDMGDDIRKIVSTGYSPAQSSTAEPVESRIITGYVQLVDEALFNYALFAHNSFSMTGGGSTDSYNSESGAYGVGNQSTAGDVGTNATGSGAMVLGGGSAVGGDAKTGVGSDPESVITDSGGASISGTKTAATAPKNMPEITTEVVSGGALDINGSDTYVLNAGTYRFDSITIGGDAELQITGPVTIYVDDQVDISGSGSVATAANKPGNLIIYSTGNDGVTINTNADFYGAIYAPQATVNISGSGSIHGSIIANNISFSGSANMHYDQALGTLGSTQTLQMQSWYERVIVDDLGSGTPTPTPTSTSSPTPSGSSTPTPTSTSSPTPSGSSTPTPTSTSSPTPSGSSTPTPTSTSSPTPSGSSTPTPFATATPAIGYRCSGDQYLGYGILSVNADTSTAVSATCSAGQTCVCDGAYNMATDTYAACGCAAPSPTATPACILNGGSCGPEGSVCCSGFCDPLGPFICNDCTYLTDGLWCSRDSNCCGGASSCSSNVCSTPAPTPTPTPSSNPCGFSPTASMEKCDGMPLDGQCNLSTCQCNAGYSPNAGVCMPTSDPPCFTLEQCNLSVYALCQSQCSSCGHDDFDECVVALPVPCGGDGGTPECYSHSFASCPIPSCTSPNCAAGCQPPTESPNGCCSGTVAADGLCLDTVSGGHVGDLCGTHCTCLSGQCEEQNGAMRCTGTDPSQESASCNVLPKPPKLHVIVNGGACYEFEDHFVGNWEAWTNVGGLDHGIPWTMECGSFCPGSGQYQLTAHDGSINPGDICFGPTLPSTRSVKGQSWELHKGACSTATPTPTPSPGQPGGACNFTLTGVITKGQPNGGQAHQQKISAKNVACTVDGNSALAAYTCTNLFTTCGESVYVSCGPQCVVPLTSVTSSLTAVGPSFVTSQFNVAPTPPPSACVVNASGTITKGSDSNTKPENVTIYAQGYTINSCAVTKITNELATYSCLSVIGNCGAGAIISCAGSKCTTTSGTVQISGGTVAGPNFTTR